MKIEPMSHSDNEDWRSITDLPSYEVSSHGRVRSLNRTIRRKDGRIARIKAREIVQHLNIKGYPIVSLSLDAKSVKRMVHRLVATAFIGHAPFPDATVNHKDGNKQNNHKTNLEWLSMSDNLRHAIQMGLITARDDHLPNPTNGNDAKFTTVQLEEARLLADLGYPIARLGRLMGVSHQAVQAALKREPFSSLREDKAA